MGSAGVRRGPGLSRVRARSAPVVVVSSDAERLAALEDDVAGINERDTDGRIVPVWKPHLYSYNGDGKKVTDTVVDGDNTWVRTFTWTGGLQTADSGWVKE